MADAVREVPQQHHHHHNHHQPPHSTEANACPAHKTAAAADTSTKSKGIKNYNQHNNTSSSTTRRKSTTTLINAVLLLLAAAWLVYRSSLLSPSTPPTPPPPPSSSSPSSSPSPSYPSSAAAAAYRVPDKVHFVRLVHDAADLTLRFTDFLAVYAAWFRWRPARIYLHTNAVPATIDAARAGHAGRWGQLTLQLPGVTVLRAQLGGVFLAFDVFALGDVRAWYAKNVVDTATTSGDDDDVFVTHGSGRRGPGHRPRSFFMAPRDAPALDACLETMGRTYWNGSASPTASALRDLVRGSRRRGGAGARDMALMAAPAFVSDQDQPAFPSDALFLEAAADTSGKRRERERDGHGRQRSSRWGSRLERMAHHPGHHPPHPQHHDGSGSGGGGGDDSGRRGRGRCDEIDWRETVLLHVSRAHEPKWTGSAFEHITPRHLLEGRSHFARLMYPVTKDLYEKGLIHWAESCIT
ncbi:glycosyl transferase [Moelleriella libera RCEF 2490]|uniref:Glycosyl transferase n=1 Tax=Moelleriella libera RCEF 2490 TaxID=1081109 RepID=A0A168F9L8_9HYPO|nr:glycosyl transferase [Moelleriella libera RCEF 2490]